ncbi:MAG: hypothetical protein ACRDIV_26775 [Ktedonobacteraceae bacterium]
MIRQTLFRYRVVVQGFLFLVAMILLFIPVVANFNNTELSLVFFSLATSMLASVLLSFFESMMGTDLATIIEQRVNFNRHVYDRGLETVHLYTEESFFEKFQHAHSIDFMSVSAHGTCQQYGSRIIDAIEKHGCKVRFLLSDPDNVIWTKSEISDALCPTSDVPYEIRDTERYLRRLVSNLKREKPLLEVGSLELRYYPIVPTASIISVDGTVVRHTPYLPHRHSSDSTTYDFTKLRGGELYSRYTETFNKVWDQSKVIFRESWPVRNSYKQNTSDLEKDN